MFKKISFFIFLFLSICFSYANALIFSATDYMYNPLDNTGLIPIQIVSDTYPIYTADLISNSPVLTINNGIGCVIGSGTSLTISSASAISSGTLTQTDWNIFNSGGIYTNSNPTPVTIGGIASGSTFNNVSLTTMWDMLLYPYQSPVFTSFMISGQTTPIEVGNSISGLHNFIWTTSNNSNINANSINIYDITGSITLFTGLANTGNQSYTFPSPIQLITQGSYTWQIQGTNTNSIIFNRNYTVNWDWKRYWGTSSNTSLTSAQILALVSNDLSTIGTGTFNFSANNYKYFCIPTSFVQPTHFIDASTGFAVDMQSPVIVSVTNIFGITTNYNVYRTTNMLTNSIQIIVSLKEN